MIKNVFTKLSPYLSLALTFLMLFFFNHLANNTGLRQVLIDLAQQHSSNIGFILLIFTLAFCIFVPGSLLSAIAYLMFGFWKTGLIVSIASVLASVLMFVIFRFLFFNRVRNWLNSKPKLAAIEHAIHNEGLYFYCLVRYIPIHFMLMVQLLSISKIRFWQFLISCVALCPIWFLFTLFSHASQPTFSAATGWLGFLSQHGAQLFFILLTIAAISLITIIAQRALTRANVNG